MTEQETIKIVTLIVMSYPASEKFKDETSLKGMVAVWKTIFKDDDAKLVEFAVQKHISVNKWTPSIAEIREQMVNLTRPDLIPPDVAWAAVEDLLCVYSDFNEPPLYELLPNTVAKVVETIGWSKLHNMRRGHYREGNAGLERVAFMDLYKPAYEREREYAMLPQALRIVTENQKKSLRGDCIKRLETLHKERKQAKENEDLAMLTQKL